VYEVKPLHFDDSFGLFILHALDQSHPKMDNGYIELSKKMVNYYAQGIVNKLNLMVNYNSAMHIYTFGVQTILNNL
jgi:hypothetical protein